MEFQAFYILVTSMVLNFIVLGISLNRPDSFFQLVFQLSLFLYKDLHYDSLLSTQLLELFIQLVTLNKGYLKNGNGQRK